MWPPQSVNTWPTPAPLSVRATSSPPVIQSAGAAPSEPPRLSSRQPPRFTDSPRPAGPQPHNGLRLALPHPQTRLGRRGPSPATACGSHCRSPEFLPLDGLAVEALGDEDVADAMDHRLASADVGDEPGDVLVAKDRKSTRLNSSHTVISYAVFSL